MRSLLLLMAILALSFSISFSQESDDYIMYQTIKLTPKPGQSIQLMEGLKDHNEKYHTEGFTSVSTWQISSGHDAGSLNWIMGPLKWSDLDKQDDEDHMPHWMENVDPYVEMGEWEYWRLNDKLSYAPEGFQAKIHYVRFFTVEEQKWNEAEHLFSGMLKVYRDNNFDMGLHVFINQAPEEDGAQMGIIWAHKDWASMDKDRKFWDLYSKGNMGLDSREFFENWNSVTDFKGAQIQVVIPELSGGN